MRNQKVDDKLNRIRTEGITSVNVAGLFIHVLPSVYPTSEISELICECFDDPAYGINNGDKVLDYGTGTGFLAIQAAYRGADVVAIDINPAAVECAQINALRHGLSQKIDARISNCFSSVGMDERFNLIVSGFPWEDAEPEDMLGYSMYDPGFQMREALFSESYKYLEKGGRILITYSDTAELRHPILNIEKRIFFKIARRRIIKEVQHYAYIGYPINS